MENSIIVEIKVNKGNEELEEMREQGIFFDAIRDALFIDDYEDVQEISNEEYDLIAKNRGK